MGPFQDRVTSIYVCVRGRKKGRARDVISAVRRNTLCLTSSNPLMLAIALLEKQDQHLTAEAEAEATEL